MEIISAVKEISNFGLSMFIAVYFIIRLDKFMKKMSNNLEDIHSHLEDKKNETP